MLLNKGRTWEQEARGATLIFSQSWMTHGSAAASGMPSGHSGHSLGGKITWSPLPMGIHPCYFHYPLHPLGIPEAAKRIGVLTAGPQRLSEAEQPVSGHTVTMR